MRFEELGGEAMFTALVAGFYRRVVDDEVPARARDRWLTHMRAALDDLALDPVVAAPVWDHLERAAFAMQNVEEDP